MEEGSEAREGNGEGVKGKNSYKALFIVTTLFVITSGSWGQLIKPQDLTEESVLKVMPQVTTGRPTGAEVALEGAVDPREYRLGPGDRLEFNVWGSVEVHQEVSIGPDGKATIPTVGTLDLAGLTLFQADSLVRVKAKSHYPRGSIDLRLTGVRRMKTLISGAVKMPGVYEVNATDRITALILAAGGLGREGGELKSPPLAPSWQIKEVRSDTTGQA
ncbi:MAG: polysaccharide biosynthesis/export family protein, partial [bacterium]